MTAADREEGIMGGVTRGIGGKRKETEQRDWFCEPEVVGGP